MAVLLAIAITAVCSIILLRLAPRLGLLDTPTGRKKHFRPTPLVGGLSMGVSFIAGTLILGVQPILFSDLFAGFVAIIFFSLAMLLLGACDDARDLSSLLKFVLQGVFVGITIIVSQTWIDSLGELTGALSLQHMPLVGIIFTVFCVVGVVNASNMIDGIDGLLGGVLLISFLGIQYLLILADLTVEFYFVELLIGGLIAFLAFNLGTFGEHRKLFMGDAGSLFLGFLLAWILIFLSRERAGFEPLLTSVSAGWIVGLPLIDTTSVMIRRISQKRSAFEPGRDHLHHLLMDAGFSHKATLATLLIFQAFLVFVGVVSNLLPVNQSFLFISFVVIVVMFHFFLPVLVSSLSGDSTKSPT